MAQAERSPSQDGPTGWLTRHPAWAEFGLVGGCLLIYFLVRGRVVQRPSVAFAHAAGIIDLERRLQFFWEPAWQHAIHSNLFQISLWNDVYFWAHAPVIVAVAFWLFFRHRRIYTLIRNAFLVSALIGIFVYGTYPVAPPRLMTDAGMAEYGVHLAAPPDYGFQDTMREHSELSYQAESLKPFVNPFAALPSLHFGWAFLIGLGVLLARRNWLGWLIALGLPALMLFAIVVTANHFLFDAVVGFAVALAGVGAAFGFALLPTAVRRARLPNPLPEAARADPSVAPSDS